MHVILKKEHYYVTNSFNFTSEVRTRCFRCD